MCRRRKTYDYKHSRNIGNESRGLFSGIFPEFVWRDSCDVSVNIAVNLAEA
jgi:hypothetical protein